VRDAASVEALLRDHRPAAVFHLAALHFIPYCNAHPEEALGVNVGGTRALLRACRQRPPRVLVFASTAAVYPRAGSPFREEVDVAPLDVYGHTKACGEDQVTLFGRETGVAVAAARLFNAFGPQDTNPHLVPEIVRQLRSTAGPPSLRLGNLEPVRDYVHVRDTAAALHALSSAVKGVEVFNVGSGEGRSVRDVVDAFATALGRPVPIEVDPERVRAVDRPQLVADSAKLRARTGWAPRVCFVDGVRELVSDLGG
jgi:UDP-glucose 4-epimerase